MKKPIPSVHTYLHTHATRLASTSPLRLDYADGTTSVAKRDKAGMLADAFRANALIASAGPATLLQSMLFLLTEVLLDLSNAKLAESASTTGLTRVRALLDALDALTPEERRMALQERLDLHKTYAAAHLVSTPDAPTSDTPSQADVDDWLRDVFKKMGLGDDTPPTTH